MNQTAQMKPSLEGVPFHSLDHAAIVAAWKPSVAAVLLEIHKSCSRSDAVAVTRFDNFVHSHEGELQVLAKFAEKSRLKPPEGVHERHPVSSVLLLRGTSRHASAGLDILLAATCEASLRASTDLERKQIAKMTSALRGALEQAPNSRLQIVLAGSKTACTEPNASPGQRLMIGPPGDMISVQSTKQRWRPNLAGGGRPLSVWLIDPRAKLPRIEEVLLAQGLSRVTMNDPLRCGSGWKL